MSRGDLISVDPPVEGVWHEEGGGEARPAWSVLVRREGYDQEFWFSSLEAAKRYVASLTTPG